MANDSLKQFDSLSDKNYQGIADSPQVRMEWDDFNSRSVINDVTKWVKPDWRDVLYPDKVRSRFMVESLEALSKMNLSAKQWLLNRLSEEDDQADNDSETVERVQSLMSAVIALWNVNFDMEDFIREGEDEVLFDDDDLYHLLMSTYIPHMDLYKDYLYEWSKEHLDFFEHEENMTWIEGAGLYDTDILLHMIMGVRCVQDLWNMMGTGVGNIHALFRFYMNHFMSLDRRYDDYAYGMLRNIILSYEREHEYSYLYHTPYGKRAHDEAYFLLVNGYLRLYDDDFFTDSNWKMIQRAWYSGIDSIVEYMKGCEQAQKYIARLQAFEGLKDGDEFEFELNGLTIKGFVEIHAKNDISFEFDEPYPYSARLSAPSGKYSFVKTKDDVYYTNKTACRAADIMLDEMRIRYYTDCMIGISDEEDFLTIKEFSSCPDELKDIINSAWKSLFYND